MFLASCHGAVSDLTEASETGMMRVCGSVVLAFALAGPDAIENIAVTLAIA